MTLDERAGRFHSISQPVKPLTMENCQYFKELEEAIDNDNLVLFCGSGTSSALELPSWQDLVINIIEQVSYYNICYRPLGELVRTNILSPLAVLDLLEEDYKHLITDTLAKTIELDRRGEVKLQEKILNISEKIITTNYDKAFEIASSTPNVILNDGKYKLAKIADNKRFIFKIHGDIDNPEDCILFTRQYKKLYQENAFLLGLRILFIQKTILFIGFSLTDPYIVEIINTITNTFDSFNRKHFIVTTDKKFNEDKFNRKVHAIILEDYSKLDQFLDSLISHKNNPKKKYAPVDNLKADPQSLQIWNNEQLDEIIQRILRLQPVTVIQGAQGSGKTSLAREIAYLCLGKSKIKVKNTLRFEYVVWYSPIECMDPSKILNSLFDEIGRVTGYIKITYIEEDDLLTKEDEINKILSSLKVLIIIDNFERSEDTHLETWIQKVRPPSEILLTSTTTPKFPHNIYKLEGLNKESFKQIFEFEAKNREIDLNDYSDEKSMNAILKITLGNPQAMLLVLALIRNNAFDINLEDSIKNAEGALEPVFEALYSRSYHELKDPERKLLVCFQFLEERSSIERDALREISGVGRQKFNQSIVKLSEFNLVESDHEDKYLRVSPTLIHYLNSLPPKNDIGGGIKQKYVEYYLNVLCECITRKYPDEEYWNSLVSSKMDALDEKRPSIFKALEWADTIEGGKAYVMKFVKLMIHYLDSRFYNRERILLVEKAIKFCAEDAYWQALLKIDALGWTFVEEGNLKAAEESIMEGREMVQHCLEASQRIDLEALAKAWLARVKIEKEKKEEQQEAKQLIKVALEYDGQPWIKYRVYMAAGDVYYKDNDFKESLKNYRKAKTEINIYGGEGGNYQINHRLGLAYLRMGDDGHLVEAEKLFLSLKQNHKIHIGRLYGEFGLAMVEFRRGHLPGVKEIVTRLEKEISERSPNNLLLKRIQQYKDEAFNK